MSTVIPVAPNSLGTADQGLGVPGLDVRVVPKRRYHVGLRPDAPVFSFHCEGVTFARFSYSFGPPDPAGNREEYRNPGMYLQLTDEQVKRCSESIRRFVARFARDEKGVVVAGNVECVTNPGFEFQAGDEPMAKFVYCRLAPEIPQSQVPGFDLSPGGDMAQLRAAEEAAAAAAQASEDARADDPASQAAKAKHKAQKGARAAGLPDPFAPQG